MLKKKGVLIFLLSFFVFFVSFVAADSGAIWTTRNDCGNQTQDANQYRIGDHVFLNGDGFAIDLYPWDITGKPGGASGDPNIVVANGTKSVNASSNFCFDAYTVEADDWGEYGANFGGKKDNYHVRAGCGNQIVDGDEQCEFNSNCTSYCSGNIFYSNGNCNTTCMCTFTLENCDLKDGWYNSSTKQWVSAGECTEKEQMQLKFRDYYCGKDCQYHTINTSWIDTGKIRNKTDGISCDDGIYCTIDDQCNIGICHGRSRDCGDEIGCTDDFCDEENDKCQNNPDDDHCNEFDILGISTCNNIPDDNIFTWDFRLAFDSVCDPLEGCTRGSETITHNCDKEQCNGCETDADCDDSNERTIDECLLNCTCEHTQVAYCGDGYPDIGEECDDGNNDDDDGCSAECMIEYCGDEIVQQGEQCDDGNDDNFDACRNDCTVPFCGDSITDPDESCDTGISNGDLCTPPYDGSCTYCTSECTEEELTDGFCGDGVLDFGQELCELPNTQKNSYCVDTSKCLDGKLGTRESGDCDSSCSCLYSSFNFECVKDECGAECTSDDDCGYNSCEKTYTDYCTAHTQLGDYNGDKIKNDKIVSDECQKDCDLATCGCDDCTVDCEATPQTYCVKNVCGAECSAKADCDDGNPDTLDSCNQDFCFCAHTQIPRCGNGILDPGEECERRADCDDNNPKTTDTCNNCNCKHKSKGGGGGLGVSNNMSLQINVSSPEDQCDVPLIFLDPTARGWFPNDQTFYTAEEYGMKDKNKYCDDLYLVPERQNYMFTGETLTYYIAVYDKDTSEDISKVQLLVDGTGIGSCLEKDLIKDYMDCNQKSRNDAIDYVNAHFALEPTYDSGNQKSYKFYACNLIAQSSWTEQKAVQIKVVDGELDACKDNPNIVISIWSDYINFNPQLALNLVGGPVDFGSVVPESMAISNTVYLANDAESGSGAVMDMYIASDDYFTDPNNPNAICDDGNGIKYDRFSYYATKGSINSGSNNNTFAGLSTQESCSAAADEFTTLPSYSGNIKDMCRIINSESESSLLTEGSEMSLTFKLNLTSLGREQCQGNFDEGQFHFVGRVV